MSDDRHPTTDRATQACERLGRTAATVTDLEGLFECSQLLWEILDSLGIHIQGRTMTVMDDTHDQAIAYFLDESGPRPHNPRLVWHPHLPAETLPVIERMWRSDRPTYRPDLDADDPYGEAHRAFQDGYGYQVRCILDLPFRLGTIGINSQIPHAFDPHLDTLQHLVDCFDAGLAQGQQSLTAAIRSATLSLRQHLVDASTSIASSVGKAPRVDDVADRIIHALVQEGLVDNVTVALVRPGQEIVVHRMAFTSPDGITVQRVDQRHSLDGDSHFALAARIPDEVHVFDGQVNDLSGDVPSSSDQEGRTCSLGVQSDDGVVAILATQQQGSHAERQRLPTKVRELAILGPHVETALQLAMSSEERQRHHEAEAALQQLRSAILVMDQPEDFDGVLNALGGALARLGFDYHGFSINVINEASPSPIRETGKGMAHIYTRDSDRWFQVTTGHWDTIRIFWKDQKIIRRRLDDGSQFAERQHIEECFGAHVAAVVDIPFSHGTVAINSLRTHAFGPQELDLLEQLAEILSEGMRRFDDLRALQRSERVYRSLVDSMQSGCALHEMVFDEAGAPVDYIFLEVNPAFEELLSLRRQDLIGRRATEVIPGLAEDPAHWIGTYGEVVHTGKSVFFEDFAEPLKRWFSVVAYRPEEGQFATVFQDVTDAKRMEKEIVHGSRMRAMGEIAAGVSHNLNNILTGVLLPAQMLLEASQDAEVSTLAREIEAAGQRAAEIVDRLKRTVRQSAIERVTCPHICIHIQS